MTKTAKENEIKVDFSKNLYYAKKTDKGRKISIVEMKRKSKKKKVLKTFARDPNLIYYVYGKSKGVGAIGASNRKN